MSEVNADHLGGFPSPYNLRDGFGTSWTIWPVPAPARCIELALGVYKADKKIDTYHVTIPKRHQRGHPEHSSYIKERDRTIVQEKSEDEEEETWTKRPRQSSEALESQMDDMES